jgi:hypothetical protein
VPKVQYGLDRSDEGWHGGGATSAGTAERREQLYGIAQCIAINHKRLQVCQLAGHVESIGAESLV